LGRKVKQIESPGSFATEARYWTPGLLALSLLSTSSPSPIGISYASNNHHFENTVYTLGVAIIIVHWPANHITYQCLQ